MSKNIPELMSVFKCSSTWFLLSLASSTDQISKRDFAYHPPTPISLTPRYYMRSALSLLAILLL
jgi:hypothetical protein